MATTRVYWATLAIRGINRRFKTRHEIHHTRDSRRSSGPICSLSGTPCQNRTAETSWSANESRSQTSLLVRNPRHLVTAFIGASPW